MNQKSEKQLWFKYNEKRINPLQNSVCALFSMFSVVHKNLSFFLLIQTRSPPTPPKCAIIFLVFSFPPALLKPGQSGQHESCSKTQLECHVVLNHRPEIDPFNITLDPGRGYNVVALGSCKL